MSDLKTLLERADRAVSDVPLPSSGGLERLHRRRDRKRRNQRFTAGVVGLAVFAAGVWLAMGLPFEGPDEGPAIRPRRCTAPPRRRSS